MLPVSQHQWKQFSQGLADGLVGPFDQQNIVEGDDCIREYSDDSIVIARMTVKGSNTDLPSYQCERVFELSELIIKATKDIFVVSDELWAIYDDIGDQDMDGEEWLKENGYI